MPVIWEDEFFNTNKILITPDSRERIKHLVDVGIIKGTSLVDYCDMESIDEIDTFFNDQTVGPKAIISVGVPPGRVGSNYRAILVSFIGADTVKLRHNYKDGGNYIGGWKDGEASAYLYINENVRQGDITTKFEVLCMDEDYDLVTGYAFGLEVDIGVNPNFIISGLPQDVAGSVTDSGIAVPTTNQWVKLTIKKDGDRIHFEVDKVETDSAVESVVTPIAENIWFGVDTLIEVNGGNTHKCYWDLCEIKSHLEKGVGGCAKVILENSAPATLSPIVGDFNGIGYIHNEAVKYTAGSDQDICRIGFWPADISNLNGADWKVLVSIYADDGAGKPDRANQLAYGYKDVTELVIGEYNITVLNRTTHLTSGVDYWVVFEPSPCPIVVVGGWADYIILAMTNGGGTYLNHQGSCIPASGGWASSYSHTVPLKMLGPQTSTEYPDHKQQFQTIEIEPDNWYSWQTLTLNKSGESQSIEKYIAVTVIDNSTGFTIEGFRYRTESEIDMTSITQSSISLRVDFFNEQGYETPELENLKLTYFVSGGEVSVAATANTYNSDLTSPIVTKTGYRMTYEATAIAHPDPDVTVEYYWFDFGDELNSGWITNNVVNHIFNKHSQTLGDFDTRVKVKYSNDEVSGWSNVLLMDVLNSAPKARMWVKPVSVYMSGALPGSAYLWFFGNDSFDIDDNGSIAQYKFDFGDGAAQAWQADEFGGHAYTVAGVYTVGLTVKDDLGLESEKVITKIKIKAQLTATLIVFALRPRQVDIDYTYDYQVTKTLAGGEPDVEPVYTKGKVLKIAGQSHLTEQDANTMRGYADGFTLVKFQYYNNVGVLVDFTGYLTSFNESRGGGLNKDAPWNATLRYKAV